VLYFLVPHTVSGNKLGYEFLSYLAGSTLSEINNEIELDFNHCTFFEGNLCAVLGNVLISLIGRKNKIKITNLEGSLRGAFTRNGFLESINEIPKTSIQNDSTILFQSFKVDDEVFAKNYFESQIFEKKKMPSMSRLARKKIIESIFEVCVNGLTHGECDSVSCCGQVFYRQSPPKAVLTIVDLGKTIKANVNNYKKNNYSGNESIMWALEEGNTTKTGSTPGGLGLKVLQDLLDMNKGKLQIVSSDGFIEYREGKTHEEKIEIDFPGTIVTIELLLNDTNLYILKVEEDNIEDIIF